MSDHATSVLAAGAVLGEGPVWDGRSGTLVFVDIKAPALWRFHPATGAAVQRRLGERVGFVTLTRDPDIYLLGLKRGLVLYRWPDMRERLLLSPEPDLPGNRINDGTIDRDGAVIFGTMDDEEARPTGSFWRWHPKDGLTCIDTGYVVSNGPVAHPDGQRLFLIDSVARRIKVLDRQAGGFSAARTAFDWSEAWGYPDGMVADAAGALWIAHWGGGAVTRLTPEGKVLARFDLPVPNVTKPCFGGSGLDDLYLTTAAIGTDLAQHPQAGDVFSLAPGVRGCAAVEAAVDPVEAFR